MTQDAALIEQARDMLARAYVPYSKFPVGAALLCADGTVFTGCNVENAAYGGCICAERAALVKAVSEGRREFVRLAVIARTAQPCTPCGICRQMLFEFNPDLEILCCGEDGACFKTTARDLLPHGFGALTLDSAK